MEHVTIPIICAPYVGARVVLDKNGAHFESYNSRQSRGDAGTIIRIVNTSDAKRNFLERDFDEHILRIEWDNGHKNSYRLKDVQYTTPIETAIIIRIPNNTQIVTGEKTKSSIQYALDQQIRGVREYETLEIVNEHTFVEQVRDFVKTYNENGKYRVKKVELKPHYDSAVAYLDTIRQDSTVLDN